MPKRSKQQVIEDEEKILTELQKNSDQGIDTIARRCKFSRQKVWRAIKHLEQTHTIWGYTAIVDDMKLNRKHYIVLIKRTTKPVTEATTTTAASTKIQDSVASEGITVESSFYTHGEHDWIITFTAPSIQHAKRFVEILNTAYEGYISKITLEETLFWVRKQRIFNPEAKKLKEFVF
jgi:DNA-binding Lrp family transcriptional regulator